MYVLNVDDFPKDKIYKCNGIIGGWLVNEKNIPILGKSSDGKWCFSKTPLLEEVLEKLPFYYNITKSLF